MSTRKHTRMYYWFRSFIILLLIGFLFPSGSVFADTPTADPTPNPYARQVPVHGEKTRNFAELAEPLPLVGSNLLLDPSFEASYATYPYWFQDSVYFGTPLCTVGDCGNGAGTAGPRSGSVWAWFGGADAGESAYLSQAVTFPACGATLQFYFWIGNAGLGGDASDWFQAYIDTHPVFSTNATQKSLYPSYQLVTVDVSSYADGGVHTVAFGTVLPHALVTFNVDDVSLVEGSHCKISGSTGAAGVTLSYTDGTPKTVTSQTDGIYSLLVSNHWTGTITPSHSCYTFSPSYLGYSNVNAGLTTQNYAATFNPAAGCADVDVTIGATPKGHYGIAPKQSLVMDFPNTLNGPVKIKSTNALPIFASQRAIFGNSFNELTGFPANQLTTDYWFTYYDDIYMSTWLMIGNADPVNSAHVEVYIGNGSTPLATYDIPHGQSVLPKFGIAGGPVRVKSTNGVNIFTSQRASYLGSFNELMGFPAGQLATDYWFTYYDDIYMSTWLMIGNPDPVDSAHVEVYVGAGTTPIATYDLAHGESILPKFGIAGGPVRVKSTNGVKIFTSERSAYGYSFNELMGFPSNQLIADYWFTYYDDINMATWLMIGNPDPVDSAHVEVYMGNSSTPIATYDLAHGQSVLPKLGVVGGPLRVRSTNGVNIFTSERVAYGNSFNELMGLPANQLTTEYWFTYYDDVYMASRVLVGAP